MEHRHTHRTIPCDDEGRDWMCLCNQGIPMMDSNTRGSEEAKNDPPEASESLALTITWFQISSHHNSETVNLSYSNQPSLWSCYSSPRKLVQVYVIPHCCCRKYLSREHTSRTHLRLPFYWVTSPVLRHLLCSRQIALQETR